MNNPSRDFVVDQVRPLAPAVEALGAAFSEIALSRGLSHREAMSTVAILLSTLVAVEDNEQVRDRHIMMMDILVRSMVDKILEGDAPS